MKGWLKKLAGDFGGAAKAEEAKPTPAPVPAPLAAPVPLPAPSVPSVVNTPPPVQGSVEDFVKAREDFFAALKSNDSATVNRIASDYPSEALGWRTEEGTPLHIAQKNGSLDAFKALLALGANKEETYPGRDFPLHFAQANLQKDFFEFLLESGADIERPFFATNCQHMNIEATTHTALGTAIAQGNKEAAITLMERDASTTGPYTHRDYASMGSSASQPRPSTAVEYATQQNQFLIADIAKRAHILRSDYLARQSSPPQAPETPDTTETAVDIGVMQPLRLKKQPSVAAGNP